MDKRKAGEETCATPCASPTGHRGVYKVWPSFTVSSRKNVVHSGRNSRATRFPFKCGARLSSLLRTSRSIIICIPRHVSRVSDLSATSYLTDRLIIYRGVSSLRRSIPRDAIRYSTIENDKKKSLGEANIEMLMEKRPFQSCAITDESRSSARNFAAERSASCAITCETTYFTFRVLKDVASK